MPQAKVAVVIPAYHELTDLEKISLAQCRKVLGNYPIVFVAPEGKIFSYFQPGDMIAHFPPQHFQSVKSYSRLMLSPDFYEAFRDFEYILLYQLDAFVFYDALEIFCAFGYDFIGAPWPYYAWSGQRTPKTPRVGNGGFSLRKVRTCQKLLEDFSKRPDWQEFLEYYEDAIFAFCGLNGINDFKTAPVELAKRFSMEWWPRRAIKLLDNTLPFGCHNWHSFSADFYVELFAQLGYDLQPYRGQMGNEDYTRYLPNSLENVATDRLVRRAKLRQPITKYLPTKRFTSVRVIRSPHVMKVLGRLLDEDDHLADKIFIYTKEEWPTLVSNLNRENLPHLILTLFSDDDLTEILEQCGFVYGEDVISFRREYMNHCTKLFHSLGK